MSPFELTAMPDTSPRFMSAGSFKKFGTESKGISGTACCAFDVTPSSTMRAMSRCFTRISSKVTGSISLVIEATDAISGAIARQCGGAVGGDATRLGCDLLRRVAAVSGRGARLRRHQCVFAAGRQSADLSAGHRDALHLCPRRQRADAVAGELAGGVAR